MHVGKYIYPWDLQFLTPNPNGDGKDTFEGLPSERWQSNKILSSEWIKC